MVQYGMIITTRAKQALKATEQGKMDIEFGQNREKAITKNQILTPPLLRVTLKCLKGKKL